MRSLPPHFAAADPRLFQPPPQFQRMFPGRLPPAARRRRVTFRCPVVVAPPELPPPLLHPSGRPARRVGPPQRFLSSLDASAWGGHVADHGGNDDILYHL